MSYKVLSDRIEKPLLDDRQYKLIKLPNELNALLIHDPTTDKSAAALDVHVGSYKDTSYNISGLAHFCEHLLFMGTGKYPSENEYASYLSKHGGHSNAFTSFEHTNYYFEVNANYLEGALDRFSQFFIDPLFDESCKDREINAVDSENKKNLQNDLWRFYQLEKLTANPKHPYNHFSTGNYVTLNDEPVKNNVNVRDVLLDFYQSNYSSNLMNLVIIGKEDLSKLTDWTLEKFSLVKNKQLSPPSYENQLIYDRPNLSTMLKGKAIMDSNKLELTFMIPDNQDENWQYLPSSYFSHLIGHESKGSIYYHLNELGLINSLSSGSTKVCNDSYVFIIELELTPKGLEHYDQVLINIFQYIKLLNHSEPHKWLFDEIVQMLEIDFKFRQKQNAAATVSKLSNSLYKFDSLIPADYIFNHQSKAQFNPEVIKRYQSHFNTDNLRIQLTSQSFDGLPNIEKWYGTNYDYFPINRDLLEKLNNCEFNEAYHFPVKNQFIPENFEIYGQKNLENPLKHPYLFRDNNKFQIWFKQDDQFEVPKVSIHLFLHLPNSNVDINSVILTQLFSELFDDELNDLSYYASLVGLSFGINQWRNGLHLKLSGYNDKISVLLKDILTKLTTFSPSPEKFGLIKSKLLQDFKNFGFEVPYLQVNTNFLTLVNEKTYLTREKVPVLQAIKFEDLTEFVKKQLWSSIFVESLIIGNLNVDHTQKIVDLLEKNFEQVPKIDSNIDNINQVIKLQSHINNSSNDDAVLVNLDLEDKNNVNSSIEYFIQVGENMLDYKLRSLTELLVTILHEPCFNQLRTKEQLGYVVFSSLRLSRSYFGYRILIQSEKSNSYLRTRIENFLQSQKQYLEEMTDETFEHFKKTLIDKKLIKLKNLGEESSKFWNLITDGYYDFKINDKIVSEVEALTKPEFLQFFANFIEPSSATKSKKTILNMNSSKAKFMCLRKTIDDNDPKIISLIDEYQNDVEKLVDLITKEKSETLEFKDKLFTAINENLATYFPKTSGKEVSFDDFKKIFPKGGIPKPVEPLSNFHYTELHL